MTLRLVSLLLATALVLVACGGGGGRSDDAGQSGAEPFPVEQVPSSPREDVPSALDDRLDERFPDPLVDPDEIRSGGPPPDGIPPIDEPRFLRADTVDFLDDEEPVLALTIGDDSRAYPIQILIWHEIVNDTVDGVPVTVTYCPLCNSAIAYDRRLDDRVLDFGTSGSLYNSALVMYDRQTESLWSHFTAQAIVGHLTGAELDLHPVATVGWKQWRDANPGGLVLSRQTGHDRDYGRNPYPGYDDIESSPFLFDGEVDGRLAAMERVVGVEEGGDAVAVRLDELFERGVIELEIGGSTAVVLFEQGAASALDAPTIAEGREVGTTGVFRPVIDGRQLTFDRNAGQFIDRETESRWNVLGEATGGRLAGSSLERIPHVDTFWFAWGAFQPETRVVP